MNKNYPCMTDFSFDYCCKEENNIIITEGIKLNFNLLRQRSNYPGNTSAVNPVNRIIHFFKYCNENN